MKIVVLDGAVVNPGDLSWDVIAQLGEFVVYEYTADHEVVGRAKDADVLLSNKCIINASHLDQLPNLKCICLLASGYNNIDTEATKEKGIVVCNAAGYGSTSVAQHVFAMILHMTNHIAKHSEMVHTGEWTKSEAWSFWDRPLIELAGKTLGIYGLGQIGSKVADIGSAMGMNIISTHKHPERDARDDVQFVDVDTLFSTSDFLTLHAPLTKDNKDLVNYNRISKMKRNAILINTGRGGLIKEEDLKRGLEEKLISGACLDVLSEEPPAADHILMGLDNCVITPHHAWATQSSRQRLLDIVAGNIRAFIDGSPVNVVG